MVVQKSDVRHRKGEDNVKSLKNVIKYVRKIVKQDN